MKKTTYDSWSRAFSFWLKVMGGVGILFIPIFWAFTSRVEYAFLPFFGALAGVGQGLDLLKESLQLKRGTNDDTENAA